MRVEIKCPNCSSNCPVEIDPTKQRSTGVCFCQKAHKKLEAWVCETEFAYSIERKYDVKTQVVKLWEK